MKNTELRSQIITDGTFTKYCEERKKYVYAGQLEDIVNTYNSQTGELQKGVLNAELLGLSQSIADECERARKCRDAQRKKIEAHIKWLIQEADRLGYDLFFGTWTFEDFALLLKRTTRREGITRLLKTICEDYIINIDFGKTTGREHYHGVIAVKKGSYTITAKVWSAKYRCWLFNIDILDGYKYGFYDLQAITLSELSEKKLSRYITKLTQHSIKVQQTYVSVKKGSAYQEWQKERHFMLKTHQEYSVRGFTRSAQDYTKSDECPF